MFLIKSTLCNLISYDDGVHVRDCAIVWHRVNRIAYRIICAKLTWNASDDNSIRWRNRHERPFSDFFFIRMLLV